MIEAIWGGQNEVSPGALDVLVNSLRSKIDARFPIKLLHTARGVGTASRGPASIIITIGGWGIESHEAFVDSTLPHALVLRDVRCGGRAAQRVELVDAAAQPDGDRVPRTPGARRRRSVAADAARPRCEPGFFSRDSAEIYQVKDDGKYLQVIDQDGHWIYRSKRMIEEGLRLAAPGDLPPPGTIVEFHQGTRYVRALSYAIKANGRAYSVQTGLALNKSMVLLSAFRAQLLLLTPGVLILAALGGHFMSRKALAPVAAIASEARRINDSNLDIRLPIAATNDEIAHLSETLNQMLERVNWVRSIRDFTANAAHELRTPLALIRAEVEVALSWPRSAEEYREACEQVQHETVRMTGLIDNLLMLWPADAGTEALLFEPLEAN